MHHYPLIVCLLHASVFLFLHQLAVLKLPLSVFWYILPAHIYRWETNWNVKQAYDGLQTFFLSNQLSLTARHIQKLSIAIISQDLRVSKQSGVTLIETDCSSTVQVCTIVRCNNGVNSDGNIFLGLNQELNPAAWNKTNLYLNHESFKYTINDRHDKLIYSTIFL